MITLLLIIEILIYTLVLWLGLYLIQRDLSNPRLRLAGLGLIAYALSLGSGLLVRYASPELAWSIARIHWSLLFLPAIFWFGATIYLLPENTPLQIYLDRMLSFAVLPAAIPIFLITAGTNIIFNFSTLPPQPGPAYPLFAALVLLPLLVALVLVIFIFQSTRSKTAASLLLLVTLFFALSASLLLTPLNLISRSWLILGISIDFIILGLVIAAFDAFDQGELLLPDLLRSLDFNASAAVLFGGLVLLTMGLATGVTLAMLTLLLATIALVILLLTFLNQIQGFFDVVAFKAFPQLRQERANLQSFATVLPRRNTSLNPATLNDDDFSRLTRRALSHMGNLPRLATNPLTRLPVIEARLVERQASDNTLERAAELKSLLTESIVRLKPRQKGDFGTTEEWRHYNALYFPYVAGLKPYSRRAEYDGLNETNMEALDWFRTYVPERTLYNWQNAAAQLIANDLKEELNGR